MQSLVESDSKVSNEDRDAKHFILFQYRIERVRTGNEFSQVFELLFFFFEREIHGRKEFREGVCVCVCVWVCVCGCVYLNVCWLVGMFQ
jgi:hypothetical protein